MARGRASASPRTPIAPGRCAGPAGSSSRRTAPLAPPGPGVPRTPGPVRRVEGFATIDLMFLLFPTVIVMLALPIGLRWKGADHAVRAVYLFHSSGDPIATVASDFVPPIAAEQLGPVLGAVRSFV